MSLFVCPICQSPLALDAKTWRCDGSANPKNTAHPFDVARQGYVNLLPVQQKKSKSPGDSFDSIAARQRFLAAAHYQPLRDLVCAQISTVLQHAQSADQADARTVSWLDIGCGEGYYTGTMASAGMDHLIAADISKPAVVELAKTSKLAHLLWYQRTQDANHQATKTAAIYPIVTSAAHLPIKAESITGISSIFSPILPQAFAQILQDDGYLVIAKPDAGHLADIREALFAEVREHDSDKFLTDLAPYFEVVSTHHVSTALTLTATDLADLLTMTPYSYRAQASRREALLAETQERPFCTEARFVVYVLQKRRAG